MDIEYVRNRFSLDGRKAIVTGSSGGIGAAVAKSLARLGAEVAILGRNEEKIRETEQEILAFGGICDTWRFDVSDFEESEHFFKSYEHKHGVPDIFVANAGITIYKHLTDTTNEEMDELVGTDLKGTVYGIRWAGNVMKEARKGNIVVVTSVNAFYPLPSESLYTGIKCALEGIVRGMASDLGHYGVRVNSFAPGAVNTDMGSPHTNEKIPLDIPLGHIALPEEVGDTVACMVTDAFEYMTGSTVLVDGGLMLRKTNY